MSSISSIMVSNLIFLGSTPQDKFRSEGFNPFDLKTCPQKAINLKKQVDTLTWNVPPGQCSPYIVSIVTSFAITEPQRDDGHHPQVVFGRVHCSTAGPQCTVLCSTQQSALDIQHSALGYRAQCNAALSWRRQCTHVCTVQSEVQAYTFMVAHSTVHCCVVAVYSSALLCLLASPAWPVLRSIYKVSLRAATCL